MDTLVARFLHPARPGVATLLMALIALCVAVALAVAVSGGFDSIRIAATDVSPFRWA